MDNGWIKLHRRILRNKLYPNGRPFTKLEAWLDLLLLVNHKEAQVEIKYKTYRINPGESVQSIKTWANRWGWSRKRVQRFFRFLKKEDMIDFVSDQNTTHLTICKWSGYQSKGTSNAHRTHIKRTSEEHHTPTNKKDKNVKNEKKAYAEFVSMTRHEYETLVQQYGERDTKKMISILNNYKGAHGKAYTSDYHAILKWAVGEVVNGRPAKNKVVF